MDNPVKAALLASLALAGGAHAQATDGFRAGAAKIDITPSASALAAGDSIRDPLFVRAIVVANGTTCAVLVGADQGAIPNTVASGAIARAATATGCPATNVIVSATHTHSGGTRGLGDPTGLPSSRQLEDAIVAAATAATKRLQPARIGYGTTSLDININRDLFTAGQWLQGPNPLGPSDKTLAVLELLDREGRPIAAYMNYAMHPINFYLSGVISADVPGEASRYVERQFGPDMVAVFTQGASGNQNPALLRPFFALSGQRTGLRDAGDTRLTQPEPWVEMARERNANTRMSTAMSRPVPADRAAAYKAAIEETGRLVAAEGTLLGEKAVDTMRYGITRLADAGGIAAASTTFQCPGRDRLDRDNPVREGALPPYSDGAPVTIGEAVLRLGDVYIAAVDGEVYNEIATRLKHEAPVSQLMMTTLANGMANSGYIYSNEAGSHLTFQVISSRLKPGCAEDKIVDSGLDLIRSVARAR